MRWAYELNDFSFDIINKPSKEQVQLDALSRREQNIPCDVDDDRIANRHHQLLEGDIESLKVVAKATWVRDGDADSDKELMAPTSMMTPHPSSFVEEDMIALWELHFKPIIDIGRSKRQLWMMNIEFQRNGTYQL